MTRFKLIVLRALTGISMMLASFFCRVSKRRERFLGANQARNLHPEDVFSQNDFLALKNLNDSHSIPWWYVHSFKKRKALFSKVKARATKDRRRLGPIEWAVLKVRDAYDPHLLKIVKRDPRSKYKLQVFKCCVYRDLETGYIRYLDEQKIHGPFYDIEQVAKSLLARRGIISRVGTGWILYNRYLDVVFLNAGLPEAYWICSDYSKADLAMRTTQELMHAKIGSKTPPSSKRVASSATRNR